MNQAGQVKIVEDKLHLSSGCSLDKLSSLAYFKHCITPGSVELPKNTHLSKTT